MITINYLGEFGNNMFQYSFGRLLAEANKINLDTVLPKLPCTQVKRFNEPNNKKGTVTIGDEIFRENNPDSKLLKLNPDYDYVLNGFFQDADLYNKYVSQIKGFFDINYPDPSLDKTLATIRLGDYHGQGPNSEIIHYDFYKTILDKIEGEVDVSVGGRARRYSGPGPDHFNGNITSADQEEKYLSYFVKDTYNMIPPEGDFLSEFTSTFKYRTLILSNSTWAWWVGFLSNCSDMYTFEKTGRFSPGIPKCHGIHVKNLWNIRNISKPVDGDFIDISKL